MWGRQASPQHNMAAAIILVVPTRIIGMADIIAVPATMGDTPSSDRADTAGKNCITQSDAAVGAHGITRSKMGSANRIVAIEIYRREGRLSWRAEDCAEGGPLY